MNAPTQTPQPPATQPPAGCAPRFHQLAKKLGSQPRCGFGGRAVCSDQTRRFHFPERERARDGWEIVGLRRATLER